MKANSTGVKVGIVAVLALAVSAGMPPDVGVDFKECFYPVGRLVLAGASPYAHPCYFNPPWLAWMVAPLAALPVGVAWRVWLAVSVAGYAAGLYRLCLTRAGLAAVLLSPFVLAGLFYSNIDWLILLGATLPPALGVWLVICKPQLGAVVIVVWAWRIWRSAKQPGI